MKVFRIGFCVALLSSFVLARGPQEHRGFYFSAGVGPAYHSFSAKTSSADFRYVWNDGYSEGAYVNTTREQEISYDAFVFPAMDFRIGKSIGNFLAIYTTFDFMFDTGNLEASFEEYSDGAAYEYSKTAETENSYMISGGGGLGFEVYPFLNPNSVMRGFHIGESTSVNFIAVDAYGWDKETGEGAYLASRFNVGMDWWVSETWSLGVEFSYTYFSSIEADFDTDPNRHLFRLMFRLTRG